jgi:hypothetical protein
MESDLILKQEKLLVNREREDRRKPKKPKKEHQSMNNEEGEGEGEGDNQEDEESEHDPDDPDAPKKPKILDEDKVLIRVRDFEERLADELNNFNTVERPAFQKLIKNLYHKQYIQLN